MFVVKVYMSFLMIFSLGFIMMTPQLFINYKMKSVAHLPWRMLTYKALNTFIDDVFAFVIKMPTMYRLGCLRDDVIFFIFLYQVGCFCIIITLFIFYDWCAVFQWFALLPRTERSVVRALSLQRR